MARALLVLFLISCADGPRPGHPALVDLHDELDDGHVRLALASGNGSSSGSAVTADLVANSSFPLRVRVILNRPIYLTNAGRGQNMIALQVYLSDNRYSTDGTNSFITLPGQTTTSVVFVAFCMDFEKDNPTAGDRFGVGQVPQDILPVVRQINDFVIVNPEADIVAAAQAAIWLAQGVSMRTIRSRFTVSAADEALARRFLM